MSNGTPQAPADRATVRWQVAVLVLASLPIIFYRLGSYGLVNGDEGFYHYVSRRMLETGDWLRLEFTGQHQVYETFMNAPLQYWIRAGIIAAFGDSYWTMRIFSAVCALASVLMTYRLVLYLAGTRAAFVAGLLQLTTYQFIYMHSARTGELEPVVCFLFTFAAYLFLRAVEESRGFLPHHVALLALVNLKAPLVLLPVLAEVAYFVATPPARRHARRWLLGWWILPLGLVWHLYQYFTLGDEALATLSRMSGQASGSDLAREESGILHNVIFYSRVIVFGAFPCSILYPLALVGLRLTAPADERRKLRLLAFFAVTVLAFFVVVAKFFPWYVNPAYPFFCALTAIFLVRLPRLPRVWTVLAVALSATALAWVRLARYEPLSERSLRLPPRLVGWYEWAGLSPAVGVPLTFAMVCLLLVFALRSRPGRGLLPLGSALIAVLVTAGTYRVLGALADTDYVSELETVRREIEDKRARGEPLDLPIDIHEPGRVRVRYAFGDDFRIVLVRKPPGEEEQRVFFKLVREGQTAHDPRPRSRSARQRERDGEVEED